MPVSRPTPSHLAWLLPLTVAFLSLGILLGRCAGGWLPFAVVLALGTLATLISRNWRRTFALLICLASLGGLLGYQSYHPALPPEDNYLVRGTIAQEVHLREDGQVQTVLANVTLDGSPAANAYWTFYVDEDELPPEWLMPGAQVEMTAKVYHPEGQVNPGGFNFREYLLQRGVAYGLYGSTDLQQAQGGFSLRGEVAKLRHALSLHLMAVMGEESGAYAAAMLLGTRDFIPEDDRAAFNDLGIAHILSVSGFHVGVLAGVMLLLLRPLPLARPWRLAIEALLLTGYCLLTGGNAPVIRASLLLLWREMTRIRHRQMLPLHLLSVSALLQLLFSPTLLTSASFQLTYGAMLGLLLVFPRMKRLLTSPSRNIQRLWEAFAASCSAQLGILLPQLYWFGQLPLLSLLLNIPVIALGTGLILLYWATLVSLPIPGLRELLGSLSAAATNALLSAVQALADLPTTLWLRQPDGLTALGWLLMMLSAANLLPRRLKPHRRKVLLVGAALMLLLFVPLPETSTEYTMFSVGNEDAALLQDQDMTVVIDTGADGQALASYLHQRRRIVDALILTHLHIDHASGVQALLDEAIPIAVCYLPVHADVPVIDEETLPIIEALRQTGTEFRSLQRGDVIELPSGQITILWPTDRVSALHDANDVNLVLQAEIGNVTMLLTGDLPGAYSHYAAVPSDILQAPHHGSKGGNTAEFVAAVDPQIILLSNRLDTREVYMAELAGDTPLYSTESCGAVTVHFLGDGEFTVQPYR